MALRLLAAQVCRLGDGGALQVGATLRGHSACVRALAWHPTDPALLLSGAEDQTVRKTLGHRPRGGIIHLRP